MPDEMIVVASGYGYKSREPFVEVRFRDERSQMSPETAQTIGANMIEAAEAALSDAFLVEFMVEVVGVEHQAAQLLGEFRIWRGKRRDKLEGDTE